MTREELINNICPECNQHNCDDRCCEDCDELLNKWLDKYDKQIRAEVYKEIAPLLEDIVTMDNICEAIGGGEWCKKNCGSTDKCLAKYVKQLKEQECHITEQGIIS